jgi:MFS family permease
MGFGNGIGSGIVMTLAADTSPEIGRPKFLGLWRELSDTGQGIGPLILSGMTAVAGLAAGITVSGVAGFAAAAAMWAFIPRRPRPASRQERQLPTPAEPSTSKRRQAP